MNPFNDTVEISFVREKCYAEAVWLPHSMMGWLHIV